jgi:hypothetical protein
VRDQGCRLARADGQEDVPACNQQVVAQLECFGEIRIGPGERAHGEKLALRGDRPSRRMGCGQAAGSLGASAVGGARRFLLAGVDHKPGAVVDPVEAAEPGVPP